MIASYAQRGLTLLAGWLAVHGLSSPAFTESNIKYLSAAAGVVGLDLLILIYRKLKTHNLVLAAKEASPRASMADVKDVAKAKPLLGG